MFQGELFGVKGGLFFSVLALSKTQAVCFRAGRGVK